MMFAGGVSAALVADRFKSHHDGAISFVLVGACFSQMSELACRIDTNQYSGTGEAGLQMVFYCRLSMSY